MKTSDKPSLKNRQNQKFRGDSFVALDFETVFSSFLKNENGKKMAFPCQIGIVVYNNREKVNFYSEIIRPPHNDWSSLSISTHQYKLKTGLTPQKTECQKEFNELWSEIEPYISNQFIIMHQAKSSDLTCLENALKYYGIDFPTIKGYLCTRELFKSTCKEHKTAAVLN